MTDIQDHITPEAYVAPIRVTQLAGDTVTLDYNAELRLGDYLKEADISVGRYQVVTVNGTPAGTDAIVEPGSVVVVVGKVANG